MTALHLDPRDPLRDFITQAEALREEAARIAEACGAHDVASEIRDIPAPASVECRTVVCASGPDVLFITDIGGGVADVLSFPPEAARALSAQLLAAAAAAETGGDKPYVRLQ